MSLLRMWRRCNLWRHRALHRNDWQRQRTQPAPSSFNHLMQRFSKFLWLRTPILRRHSWRTPTLVTVKFTAKYSNSWARCFLQTNQHHQIYTNYNGRQAMLVWWMCLLRFAQTVNSWRNVRQTYTHVIFNDKSGSNARTALLKRHQQKACRA